MRVKKCERGNKMKLVAIVGTNSKRSTNRKLLRFMAKHFAKQADIEILEIKDLPAFNEPEDKIAPQAVASFTEKIVQAQGVIIATPEYDHTIPAPLSSALEWIAYTSRPLINKPVMIVGASLGLLGTSRAQAHLRQILDAPELKARLMPGNEFLLGHSEQVLTDEGELTNADKVAELEDCFAEFLEFVSLTNQLVKEADTKRKQAFAWEAAD
ncbi:NADPH-dependent FMN reductase [Streptococcus downei MFe28]|uniref:NADPH-dependent FMN reductase n=2 Tax=Streptococcus downei TaxID=1317 RepID=A0A380JGG5_STRDO|nr:NADPH-dependent FMN reductase [Streptococcus downei MFe28]